MATFDQHCKSTHAHVPHSWIVKRRYLQGLRWVSSTDTYRCAGTRNLMDSSTW